MIKRRWFKAPQNANPLEIVKEYVIDVVGPQLAATYHRKKMYGGSAPNEYALLAWQARILQRARDMAAHDGVSDFKQDDRWLSELAKLTRLSDGAQRSIRLLAENGIALVIERHLPGSYLDGAAMLDAADRPVIGLTLRYDRLDNFWFVLFHEIGHVFLHLSAGVRFDFFDEERVSPGHSIEADADRFALNTLIPAELWDQCLSRFALSEEAVRIDAATLDIHPSIIAGRIRKELPSTAGLLRLVMIETCPPSASRTSSLERNRRSRTENTSISRTVVPPHRVARKRSTPLH